MNKKTSLIALITSFALTTAGVASAQAPSDSPSFDDLIASEVGQPGGLMAGDVALRAAKTSPTARARSEELVAAGAEVDRALLGYVPRVTLTASYTRLSDTQGEPAGNVVIAPTARSGPLGPGTVLANAPLAFETPLNQYALQASISVPVSDYFLRVRPSVQGAEFAENAAKERLLGEKLKAAADARLAYYDWVRASLNVVVAEQALTLARAHHADAKTAFDADKISEADVLRVEAEVARSELLVTSTRNLQSLTEEQVRISMHDSRPGRYRIGEDVRQPAPTKNTSNLADLWAEAERSRPELRALDAEKSARERSAVADRAGYVPRFELVGGAAYSNPNPRIFPQTEEFRGTWEAGARATWVISDIPSTGAKVRGSEATTRAVAAERSAVADGIHLEVMKAFQDRQQARVAEETTVRRLAAAEESYRVRRLQYQNGRATSVELLDAETELTRARLDAVDARIDGRVAEVRLAYAVGRPDRP